MMKADVGATSIREFLFRPGRVLVARDQPQTVRNDTTQLDLIVRLLPQTGVTIIALFEIKLDVVKAG